MRPLVDSERGARRSRQGPAVGRVPIGRDAPRRAGAFTLTDVLVSMAVIAVLMSLMLPSLGVVKEAANRIVCRSNVRQIGIGVAMYADDRQDSLPLTTFVRNQPGTPDKPAETVTLRLQTPAEAWDGLGRLYALGYLPMGPVFYCPSHKADLRFERLEPLWRAQSGTILGNYQYRGMGPNRSMYLNSIEPSRAALVSDSLRNRVEFSHEVGANVLRADLSVYWYRDNGTLIQRLDPGDHLTTAANLQFIWSMFDGGGS